MSPPDGRIPSAAPWPGPSVHRRGASAFRLGEGFIGWVVVHREPAFTNHPASDPRFVARDSQVWTPSAVMAVPLLSGRSCIGVLSVSRKVGKPYRKLDLDLLHLVAERVRRAIADTPFSTSAGALQLTVSLGICRLTTGDDAHSLVHRADQALYSAKRRGRNRVIAAKTRRKKKQAGAL